MSETTILDERAVEEIEKRIDSFPLSPFQARALCATVKHLRAQLHTLRQQVEDTVLVAQTDEDADGFISAYHFQTGAIHRLLAEARKGD